MAEQLSNLIPKAPGEWEQAATKHDVQDISVHDVSNAVSASKIGSAQFLALRATWKAYPPGDFLPENWGVDMTLAWQYLSKLPDWNKFFKESESGGTGTPYLGSFDMLWDYQLACNQLKDSSHENIKVAGIASRTRGALARREAERTREVETSPTPASRRSDMLPHPPSTPKYDDEFSMDLEDKLEAPGIAQSLFSIITPIGSSDLEIDRFAEVEDEQIVNTALVLMLQGVCRRAPLVMNARWTLQRKAFYFNSEVQNNGKTEIQPLFQARTDGHLVIQTNDNKKARSLAIIEVKPKRRGKSQPWMQETAQLAAWIFAGPDEPNPSRKYRRLMFSQDREEIYLIIGSYGQGYIDYLNGVSDPKTSRDFLAITQYGPFLRDRSGHMRRLGNIMLALTQQLSKKASEGFPGQW